MRLFAASSGDTLLYQIVQTTAEDLVEPVRQHLTNDLHLKEASALTRELTTQGFVGFAAQCCRWWMGYRREADKEDVISFLSDAVRSFLQAGR